MFGIVWGYYSSKLKGKQYKQNTSPKSNKSEIKILNNLGLASSGFEQPGPGVDTESTDKAQRRRRGLQPRPHNP